MKKLFISGAIALCALNASAQRHRPPPPPPPPQNGGGPAQQVIESTQRLSYLTSQRAYYMSPNELGQLTALLKNAESLVLNAGSQPQGPLCQLKGYGTYRGYYWNYMVWMNGSILDSSNEFPEILTKMSSLQKNGICVRPYSTNDICNLGGYGSYRGYYWNYMIKVNNEIVHGTNEFSDIKAKLQGLNENVICQNRPSKACSLQGYGTYRGYYWNFRVLIGDEIVEGLNVSEQATARLNEMKQLGLCY